jgi:hypothetical protein
VETKTWTEGQLRCPTHTTVGMVMQRPGMNDARAACFLPSSSPSLPQESENNHTTQRHVLSPAGTYNVVPEFWGVPVVWQLLLHRAGSLHACVHRFKWQSRFFFFFLNIWMLRTLQLANKHTGKYLTSHSVLKIWINVARKCCHFRLSN